MRRLHMFEIDVDGRAHPLSTMDPFEKSTTVDPEVRAYISSLVNAVGGSSTYDNSYQIGDDAVAVLKDLQRWLRLYDEKTNRLDVKRCLAEANLVRGDLLEILAQWTEKEGENNNNKFQAKLALACLELLVPLTWPLVLENDAATVNHHRHVPYLLLAQVGYKRAILHADEAHILRCAVRVALPAMATPRRERSTRDEGIIRLMLYFFRNVALITQPQHLPSQGDENEVSRSATIDAFHHQDIFRLLLTIGSGIGEEFHEQGDVVLLEIIFHLLKGVDARKLFLKKEQVHTEETAELQMLMHKEKAMRNGYRKHAPTRHNRFGTMIWVKRDDMKNSTVSGQASITNQDTTLHQMDASKRWNKPQYRGQRSQEGDESSEWGTRVELTETARNQLRRFVDDFLDSSFNPLFVCLRKAMEREAERVQAMHQKQYFYLISWFLTAEAARREQSRGESTHSSDPPAPTSAEDNSFAYIAAVLDQETFVLLNRQMQTAWDNKNWQDLQATLLAFTRILLTVQSMAESRDEEDQEIAENIQNRIFYEEATHDRIVQILRGYTHQGFAYLDSITECVHVFVRMLERYSKQNADLQIRSKRRARRKAARSTVGAANGGNNDATEDAEEAAEDERDAHRTVSERKFDFAKFSAKFLSQPCVNTFITLLHFYRDLTPVQMKRAHRYFYRLAFKHELSVLLFRVDVLALFQKLIKGPEGLDPVMEGFGEWETLIRQVFRRCVKWMERDRDGDGWKEAAVVEMLFSKIPGTVFYLQNGYEKVVEKRTPRPPAELEVKKSVEEGRRVAVAVSVCVEQAKMEEVEWVKSLIRSAGEERRSWEDDQSARMPLDGDEDDSPESHSPPSIFITPDNEDRKLSLFKDKHLRLLLTTLGFQRLGLPEDVDAQWIIPSDISASKLEDDLQKIIEAERDPLTFEDDKTAADLIRSKSANRPAFVASDSEDSSAEGSGGAINDTMFSPNLKEKRKAPHDKDTENPRKKRRRRRRNSSGAGEGGEEPTESEVEAKRKAREKREREKNSRIKSRLYVTLSDDESDAEGDEEFFRLEAERRERTASAILGLIGQQGRKKKEERVILEKEGLRSDNDGDEGDSVEGVAETKLKGNKYPQGRKRNAELATPLLDSDSDDDAEDNGPVAPSETSAAAAAAAANPKQQRGKTAAFTMSDSSDEDDDEDEDHNAPLVLPEAGEKPRRMETKEGKKKTKKKKGTNLSALLEDHSDHQDEDDDDDDDADGTGNDDSRSSSSNAVDSADEDGGGGVAGGRRKDRGKEKRRIPPESESLPGVGEGGGEDMGGMMMQGRDRRRRRVVYSSGESDGD